jgi:hypothetical protein
MPRKGKQRWDGPRDEHDDFVPAVFARSMEEAEDYRQLLDDHDIPAIIGAEEEPSRPSLRSLRGVTRGLPVLVPEAMLDEASEVIAERDNADEFGLDREDADEEEEEEEYLIDGEVELAEPADDEGEDQEEADEDLFGDDDSHDGDEQEG